ncbi:MAG TPA: hypothetical protein VK215_04680 [Acidimicrobiales bacterium]|nr:hypothetical protein [Acidimicrobiales bacterium]HLN41720.1 hypothetical protein [Acidimicrobiales bacterium]
MAVVEVVTFRLAADVEQGDFLVADKRAQTEFLYMQTGLLRRTTARGMEGEWLVVTLWATGRDADTAALSARDDPAASLLTSLMDPSSITSNRYDTLE